MKTFTKLLLSKASTPLKSSTTKLNNKKSLGTVIIAIKHHDIVNTKVVINVITIPCSIKKFLLKKNIERNQKLKELIKAKNKVKEDIFILFSPFMVLCNFKSIFMFYS